MNKTSTLTFAFALLLVTSLTEVVARDYYVAKNGNDANPGTITQPYASINKGVDLYNAGDTIYVRAGTYSPTSGIYFYRSGSASAPITFRAYPGEIAVLDGSNMPNQTMLVDIECNYFIMQDFEIKNSKWNGISNYGACYTTIKNCKVHDCLFGGISVGKGDLTSTHDVTIDGCTVYNNCHMNDPHTINGGWPGALTVGGATNVTVKNCNVYKNQGEGIIFYLADKCRSSNNISHDNYGVNMYIDNATNCVIERNFLYTTGDATYYRGGNPSTGIQYANEVYNNINISANNTIVNNILVNNNYAFYYGNYGRGGGLKNVTFANNSIYLCRKEVFHVDSDSHSNTTFCNNISWQSSGGTQVVLPSTLAGMTFTHNLWYGGDIGAAWSNSDAYTDPKFVNAGGTSAADYKLQSGSPAHALGMTVSAVATDFFGTSRPATMDAGAAVYDAPATTPPVSTPTPPVSTPPTTTPPTTPTPTPINTAPAFNSVPSIFPNPAQVGDEIEFTAAATDAQNDTLTYAWQMGDGTVLYGASVSKTYSSAGTYTIVATVSDGKAYTTSTQTLTVSAASTPAPTPDPTPAPEPTPPSTPTPTPDAGVTFDVSAMAMNFNLAKANRDTMYIIGSVPLPENFSPLGASAVITVSSLQHTVMLNVRGQSTDRTFRLTAKMKKGKYLTNRASFVMQIKQANLFSPLKNDLGLEATNGRHFQTVALTMTIGGTLCTSRVEAGYIVVGVK